MGSFGLFQWGIQTKLTQPTKHFNSNMTEMLWLCWEVYEQNQSFQICEVVLMVKPFFLGHSSALAKPQQDHSHCPGLVLTRSMAQAAALLPACSLSLQKLNKPPPLSQHSPVSLQISSYSLSTLLIASTFWIPPLKKSNPPLSAAIWQSLQSDGAGYKPGHPIFGHGSVSLITY